MKKLIPHLKKFKPHLIALGIFIAISAIYFSPVFEGKILSAHDIDTWKGMSKEVQDFRSETGEEALWTKRMFSGMPAYQISTQSNGNLIQYVDKAFQLGLPRPIDMLFLYLIGFYILLLTLKIDYKLAIVGAIGFAFSSYFFIILQNGHMTKAHAIAYLPLIIASVLHTFSSKKWLLGAVFTSLFVALQLYSNHYQITYYTIIILFFIGIVQFVKELQDKTLPNFFKKVGILVVAALLGGATNYTRLATTMEYGPETQRGKSELVTEDGKEKNDGLGLEYATKWSQGKAETMTFIIPNFMGGTKSVDDESHLGADSEALKYLSPERRYLSAYWGNQPGTAPTYVGAIIMFLFVLGVLYVKSSYKYWILITTILSIMLAWGHNFMGLTEFCFNYLPGYNKFRAVTMAMIIAEFGISLLAILALNKFLNNKESKVKEKKLKLSFYIAGGITLLLAIIPSLFLLDFLSENELKISDKLLKNALSNDRESILKSDAWRSFVYILLSAGVLWMFIKGKIKKQYVVIILGILILSDMWSVDKRYLNETHFVEETESSFVATKADNKIIKNNKNNSRVLDLSVSTFNDSRSSYFHNSIGGYHAAKLKRYQDLLDNQKITTPSVLSMLNCGWVLYDPDNNPKTKNPPAAIRSERYFKSNYVACGNAWFVSKIDTVENANEELEYLDSFDPKTTAIIDKRFLNNITNFTKDKSTTIKLDQDSYQPNHLTYNLTNINSDQLAVFSEIYYEKGWNAYIDGKIVPYFRANYTLRAMMVPAGTTKIEFKFEPTSYSIGESVAYASSIILLLLLGFVSYKELKLKTEESIEE